jgi:hypothetical protein
MSVCITGDTMYIIAKFLNPLDIVNVYKACSRNRHNYYTMFQQAVINKIDGWFREYFGDRYLEFRNSMIKSKAVISGSFILQMILDETWNSDIDIFMHSSSQNIQLPDNVSWQKVSDIENFLYSDHDNVKDENLRDLYGDIFDKCGCRVRQYQINQKDDKPKLKKFTYFQTISISDNRNKIRSRSNSEEYKNRKIIELLNIHNDFDICKNAFWYDHDGCHIYISDPSQIINKKFKGKTKRTRGDTRPNPIDRKEKYELRGFKHSE